MDLKTLEYVVTIAQCGNISRAAEKLYITQSGLNQQLIKLENALGLKLFERDHHHLHITKAGEIYVQNAREILRIQRNTFTQLNDLKQDIQGEICMGLTHEHGIDLFTAIYPEFHERFPNISFSLVERIVGAQYRMLEEGSLDMGIVLLKKAPGNISRNCVFQPIYKEDLLLGVPLNHPLAGRTVPISSGKPLRVIDLQLFAKDPFALIFDTSTMRQEVINPMFEEYGFHPKILIETAMNSALAQLVSKGICCTILPHSRVMASSYRDQCAWFRMLGNPTWSVSFVHRKDYRLGGNLKYLVELAKRYGQRLEKEFEKNSPHYRDVEK